ncbi:ParB-like nuclease domain-containing protein [candidate division KSB1 bacterium]|nr:ParB-like nuclease domain-containing protein [candidate division KSB1 bacterium]
MKKNWKTPQGVKIRPNQIDLEDDFYRMTFLPDLGPLNQSVQKVGILHPVFLEETGRVKPYRVISGFRRVWVCRKLGLKEIPAVVYGKEERTALERFELNLLENTTVRSFNLIEKALVLGKLVDTFGVERKEVVQSYMPLVGLQPSPKLLGDHLSLRHITSGMKEYVVKKGVVLANAILLSGFSPGDQGVLLPLLSSLYLSTGMLRELIEWIDEIALREDVEVAGVVNDPGITQILFHPQWSVPTKTEKIRQALRARKYPQLTGMTEAFDRRRKRLKLPPRVALSPPPFFEGDHLKLSFQFKGADELKEICRELVRVSEQRELGELLEML